MSGTKTLKPDEDGYSSVTKALMALVNKNPGLDRRIDEHFEFCETTPEEGLSIWATSGSAIYDSKEGITGHIWQECLYPFTVIYRASGLTEKRKIQVNEWIDTFGSWLTRQTVVIGKKTYHLSSWPELSDGRVIRDISKTSTAYISTIDDGKTEVNAMNLQIRYRNEFDR